MNNAANGVSVAGEAAGEIRNNLFEQTGFGVAVGGKATTAVTNNQIRGNRSGIVITNSARPMVQGNTSENNRDYGVVALDRAIPGMGNNTFRGNGQQDSLLVNGGGGTQTAATPAPPPPVTGNSQGAKFSCVVSDRATGCQPNNQLFTLSQQNASNAAEVLKSLIAFTVTGEGAPVFESEDSGGGGGEQPYAALSEIDDKLQTEQGLWFAAP